METIGKILHYARLGYKVFPCLPMRKRPATADGLYNATSDEEQIRQWYQEMPRANWAINCEDLIVIDCDTGNDWHGTSKLIEAADCPVQVSPGGLHFIYRRLEEKTWGNTSKQIAPQIDTKTTGGYFVVEPSVRHDGNYEFDRPLVPIDDLPLPPDWLVKELDEAMSKPAVETPPPRPLSEPVGDIYERAVRYVEACPEAVSGQGGHTQTFSVATALVHGFGLDEAEAYRILDEYYNPRCDPPWSESELRHKIKSSLDNPPSKQRGWLLESDMEQEYPNVDISSLIQQASELIKPKENDFGDFEIWDCPRLMASDLSQDFLIDGVLVEKQPCIVGGPKKCLKTSILLDMAVSAASGTSFLRRFSVSKPRRVLVMTGESGLVTVRGTIERIAQSAHVNPSRLDKLFVCDKVPRLDNVGHLSTLSKILDHLEPEIVIFDPAYLMLATDKPESLFSTGIQLSEITQMCLAYGATMVLAHHNSKGRNDLGRTPELDDLSWSGFSEFARQWILLGRKKAFDPLTGQHELKVTIGGSYGHGGQYEVAVREGIFPDRVWDVQLLDIGGIIAQPNDRHVKQILEVLALNPEGLSKKKIREATKLNNENAKTALDALIANKLVEEIESTHPRNKTNYQVFRLVVKSQENNLP